VHLAKFGYSSAYTSPKEEIATMLISHVITLILISLAYIQADDCRAGLGMSDKRIKDVQIYSKHWLYQNAGGKKSHYRPHMARLNDTNPSGGWCSENVHNYKQQFIVVDLLKDTKITGFSTQGRGKLGPEFVPYIRIEYRRQSDPSGSPFRKYEENGKWKTFQANVDQYGIKENRFTVPVIAQIIRIYPYDPDEDFSIHCMRFELHGCEWENAKDTLEEYSGSLGGERQGLPMKDDRYDGTISTKLRTVHGGLGRLSDEIYGNEELPGRHGSPWIAYDTLLPTVTFRFREKRLFEKVMVHVNNRQNAGQADDIQIFRKVSVYISPNGTNWQAVRHFKPTKTQIANRKAFSVYIDLKDTVSRFVKLKFHRKAQWLLISEVKFFTFSPDGPFHTAAPTRRVPPMVEDVNRYQVPRSQDEDEDDGELDENEATNKTPPSSLSFPIILTITLVGIVITVIIVVMVIRKYQSSKAHGHSGGSGSSSHGESPPAINAEYQNKQDAALLAQQQTPHRIPIGSSQPFMAHAHSIPTHAHQNIYQPPMQPHNLNNGRFVHSGYSSGSGSHCSRQ